MKPEFGPLLKNIREEISPLTQADLAKYLGVSKSFISRLEGGSRLIMSAEIAEAIGLVIEIPENVKLDFFLGAVGYSGEAIENLKKTVNED